MPKTIWWTIKYDLGTTMASSKYLYEVVVTTMWNLPFVDPCSAYP